MSCVPFDGWFRRLSGGSSPHAWQAEIAAADQPRSRLLRVPTGFGKTLGVLAAWSWHRLHRNDATWPRRLVWCLPMRVLVEQTHDVVRHSLAAVDALWDGSGNHRDRAGVHLLMGGVDPRSDWDLYPDECAVLIGTQDMLLSRALNRGYASGRGRWPVEFGLLSHDALWVMDEVQLMDVGLATSAQIQAYLDHDAPRGFRPRVSWWMSATLQPEWLRSVDTAEHHAGWVRDPVAVPRSELTTGLGAIEKRLEIVDTADGINELAALVATAHQVLEVGEHGKITLVVCNTVNRATETAKRLRKLVPAQDVELVHSRFRPVERDAWRDRFLSRERCTAAADRIIVATQVVEAGVDISAGCVVTELAPWSSLVQRFGRCARYGGSGRVVIVNQGCDKKLAAPYETQDLEAALAAVRTIASAGLGVGVAMLEQYEAGLSEADRRALYPYDPTHLLLKAEFEDLFDTTPDLTGADLDISRFIRSGDERDLQVFWLDVPARRKGEPAPRPPDRYLPRRDELCPVPFLAARDWLCGKAAKGPGQKPRLLEGKRAWTWDWIEGRWKRAERSSLVPGRVVCVASDSGGYSSDLGFDPGAKRATPVQAAPLDPELEAEHRAAESPDADELSEAAWKTIACHCAEVAAEAEAIAQRVGLDAANPTARILKLAGRWHDVGKAHPAFQGQIRRDGRPDRSDLAKAPRDAWSRPARTKDDKDKRPGLRHELASALGLFAVLARYQPSHAALLGPWTQVFELIGEGLPATATEQPQTAVERDILACSDTEFDLLAFLVAAHHGKVRASLQMSPRDQDYRERGDGSGLPIQGVREGDALPALRVDPADAEVPALTLTLEPASMGLSPRTGRSWRERTLALLADHGPGGLAWLEALLRAADRRASRLTTADPALELAQVAR